MAPSRKKSSAPRSALTAEAIVDAATVLIERDGLAAFTMRSLGRELGMSAMAVYGYFPSREAVLSAVLTRYMATMNTLPVPGERWDDTLRRTTTSLLQVHMAHPQLVSIKVGPGMEEPGLAEHTAKIVDQYLAQGMPESILRQMWAMVDAYLTGFVRNAIALRLAGDGEPMRPMAAELRNACAHRDEGVSSGMGTSASAEEAASWRDIVADAYSDEMFAAGIELIIQGIRGLAAPDPCEWRTPLS